MPLEAVARATVIYFGLADNCGDYKNVRFASLVFLVIGLSRRLRYTRFLRCFPRLFHSFALPPLILFLSFPIFFPLFFTVNLEVYIKTRNTHDRVKYTVYIRTVNDDIKAVGT